MALPHDRERVSRDAFATQLVTAPVRIGRELRSNRLFSLRA
jgi:hypothetical protein